MASRSDKFGISLEFDKRDQLLLEEGIRKFGNKVLSQVATPAVAAASRPVMAAMKSHAREVADTGATARSIGMRRKTYKHSGIAIAMVGQRSSYQDPETGARPSKYAHILEFGTKRQRAIPIQHDAWSEKKSEAKTQLTMTLRRLMTKLAKKEFAKTIRALK